MRHLLVFAVATCLAFATQVSFAEDEVTEKTFSKRGLSLSYPSTGWNLEDLPPAPNSTTVNVRLTSVNVPNLSIILTFQDDLKELSEKDLETPSADLAAAFGTPIALKWASTGKTTVLRSTSLINFEDVSALGTRFIVTTEGSTTFRSLETFARLRPPNSSVVGAISSEGKTEPSGYTAAYYDALYEAYNIVQSISVKEKEVSAAFKK
jgi:hypothetical protein